jgi:hypothetical protein
LPVIEITPGGRLGHARAAEDDDARAAAGALAAQHRDIFG